MVFLVYIVCDLSGSVFCYRKEIMDSEWKRRQALVGRFQYPHHNAYKIDERLARFDDIK